MPIKPDEGASLDLPPGPASKLSLESALSARASQLVGAMDEPPTQRRRPLGLRTGLWFMLAIGLLPALAGTAWYLRQLRDVAVRDAFAQADLVAIGTAESLRWLMQDAQAMMASIAGRPRVKALDGSDCDSIFRDFHDVSPSFKALSLRRLDGSSVCSELQQPPSQQSVAAAPWFQAAVRSGGFHASDTHFGAVAKAWTTRLTSPVTGSTGQVEGLLITPVDLTQLQQRLFAKLPANVLVAVVDASNKVVVRSKLQEERVGKPAAEGVARVIDELRRAQQAEDAAAPTSRQFVEIGIAGVRQLFVVRGVPMTGWYVVSTLPEEATLQAYYTSRNRALAAVVAILALVVLAAWRVSRGILVPIAGLAHAARGVGAGDNTLRAPESGPREISEVAREFNRMVAAAAESAQRLVASENHYRTLLQNLPVAVVAHAGDGAIEVFNDRACSLLRMSPDQMRGRLPADRVWYFVDAQGQRLPPRAYPVSRVLESLEPTTAEVLGIVSEGLPGTAATAPRPDPTPHTWVMVTGYPQFDERHQIVRAIVVFVDVTTQHQADELRLAKELAEAASKAKTAFLSRVSHELRTPLNAINGFSELMLMDQQLQPKVKDKARHVLNAGKHLLALINQILELTRIESGQMQPVMKPVPLWPLLEECVAICGPMASSKGVTLRITRPRAGSLTVEPIAAYGDETYLRQIFINLLSNGIKYNRPDGTVTLSVEARADAHGTLGVTVKVDDTGHGLSESQLGLLFQPFNRLGLEHSGIEGNGLGLSISRQLALAMSGDITVQSVVNQGSCFAVHLQGTA